MTIRHNCFRIGRTSRICDPLFVAISTAVSVFPRKTAGNHYSSDKIHAYPMRQVYNYRCSAWLDLTQSIVRKLARVNHRKIPLLIECF